VRDYLKNAQKTALKLKKKQSENDKFVLFSWNGTIMEIFLNSLLKAKKTFVAIKQPRKRYEQLELLH